MGRMTYLCGVDENKEQVFFEFREDDKPLAHMTFFASDAEQLILNLARARMSLEESVNPELEAMSRVPTEQYPAWRLTWNHSGPQGTALLALRHQGMGWLGFLLEKDRAKAIAAALSNSEATP